MAIALFIDGAYVWKVFHERIDYLKLRRHSTRFFVKKFSVLP
jgi:hypothetical protein